MSHHLISLQVNGDQQERFNVRNKTLAEFIREDLGLTGTKVACGTGDCGACTVIIDGQIVTSCLVLAAEADGSCLTTVEGLSVAGVPCRVSEELVASGGVQCGFCTPGFVVAASTLLLEIPNPTELQIREGLAGNICRCTGYAKIFEAVAAAATAKS